MKIYTKIGDKGFTKLPNGKDIPKDDILIQSYGKIDTLVSFLGLSKSIIKKHRKLKALSNLIEDIQLMCFKLMTDISHTNIELEENQRIREEDIKKVEKNIDEIWSYIGSLRNFVIPGQNEVSSSLHVCRAICREIEPLLVKASKEYNINKLALILINRISDLLFSLAVKTDLLINKKLNLIKKNKKIRSRKRK